jgi:hypothetical protein
VRAARSGDEPEAAIVMMLAVGSTDATTLPASELTVSPGSRLALAASTSRVTSSFWIVASWRSASVVLVRVGSSLKSIVAFALYVFGRASDISSTSPVTTTTIAAIKSFERRSALA